MSNSIVVTGAIAGVTLNAGDYLQTFPGGRITINSAYGAAVRGIGGPSTVTNAGSIIASGFRSAGVRLEAGGTVTNSGTIGSNGYSGYGVRLSAGGTVINDASGSIGVFANFSRGIQTDGGTTTVVNDGTISGVIGAYLQDGGTVTNGGPGDTAALIHGIDGVFVRNGGVTLTNYGTISATSFSVYSGAGGSVTNGASGSTEAVMTGEVSLQHAPGTVVNYGTISASGFGDSGVLLTSGGSVTNAAGALIKGAWAGVSFRFGNSTLNNDGTIMSSSGSGVRLNGGVRVTNHGLIEGQTGIAFASSGELAGTSGTIDNFGTIVGDAGIAVAFSDSAQTLKLEAGSTLSGAIAGFQGADTIDFVDVQATALSFSGGTLSVMNGAATVASLGFTAAYASSDFTLTSDGHGGTNIGLTQPSGNNVGGSYDHTVVLSNPATQNPTTIATGSTIIAGNGVGVLGLAPTAWTLTNLGTIVAHGTNSYGQRMDGVVLQSGGLLINGASGLIDAGKHGVYIGVPGTVANSGTIEGQYSGVYLKSGGSVSNAAGGLIYGYQGIYARGSATVTNAGTITGGRAVNLYAGGTVTNQSGGQISGSRGGIYLLFGSSAVTNLGTISAGANYGRAIFLFQGGDVTNGAVGATDARIASGAYGIIADYNRSTVTNYGTISATRQAVSLHAGGVVINGPNGDGAALIESTTVAVSISGGDGTVANGGTIAGSAAVSITGGPGSVSNSGTMTAFAGTGVLLGSGGNALNSGLITGTGNSVVTYNFFYGWYTGISASGAAGAGVVINGAGALVNSGTVLATGHTTKYAQDYNFGSHTSLISDGPSGIGAALLSGSVTNTAGGLIEGNDRGVSIAGADGSVTNAGTITGGAEGVVLSNGGHVTNNGSGALIEGGNGGVNFTGGVGTVVNAGTITGGAAGTAVALDRNFGGLLVADAGAVFVGLVTGGNAALSTLELASGPGIGTLSGLGTQFVQFGSIIVDAGANWLFSGNNTIASTVTLTNAGSLSFTGTFDDAGALIGTGGTAISFGGIGSVLVIEQGAVLQGTIGGFLPGETIDLAGITATGATLGAGNVLTVQESGGGTQTLDLATNQNYAGYGFTVTSDGSGGSDITVSVLDPGPTAHDGATTLGHNHTIDLTGFIKSLVTPGLPGDTETITAVTAPSGSVNLAGGVVTYTTPSSGPVTLSYTVKDQYNNSATGSIVVTVDTGPTTIAGTTTVGHGKTVDLTAAIAALVHPGIGTDSETVQTISAVHGAVSVSASGIVTYTAPSSSVDTLGYTVADQYGDSATGTLKVTVDPGPTAGAASITLLAGQTTDLTAYLLGLDAPGIVGDVLTLTGDTIVGTHGTVTLTGGVLSYLAPSATGTDSFGYTVSDQYGDTASATVTVTIASSGGIGNGSGTVVLGNTSGPASFGNGSVTVVGGNGNDVISGGNGTNTVTLGNGNDTVVLGNGSNTITLGAGNDSVTVGNQNNTITVIGSATSVDTIVVGNGSNTLNLGAGTYNVTEGNGADTIVLGNGKYNVTAGHGSPDLFIYTVPTGLLTMSFSSNDELVFRDSGFNLGVNEGHGTASLQAIAASLLSSKNDGTFATAGNRFAYDQSHGNLYYDADGTGSGSGSTLIAHLTNNPHLTAASLFFTS
jgi:hypothetical protein